MASPPLRGSPEWSAKREVEVLLGLTRGNHYRAQQLWLQRERYKAEASQVASAGSPQASQRAAGCQAKPATAGSLSLCCGYLTATVRCVPCLVCR